MPTYKIVRIYLRDKHKTRTIRKGLTLEEAQAHCSDPETRSTSATNAKARQEAERKGPWFDGYDEE